MRIPMNKIFSRLLIAFVKSLRHLPMRARWGLARIVAAILWRVVPKRRHIIDTNLRLCFPELSEVERTRLAKRVYLRLARAAVDHGTLWKGSVEEVRRLVHIKGIENILESKSPLIVVAPHFAGLDAAGIALNTYVRGVSLYQRQRDPVWDEAILQGRLRFSNPVLIAKSDASDLRPVMRAMRQGLPFYYLPDMDNGRRNSIFVPFFGQQAATVPMVSRLSKVMKAKVLWCIATMTEEGYEVEITPPIENFPTADSRADTCRLNAELEAWIRKHPDQYLWVHRRFKTRPDGEPSVY